MATTVKGILKEIGCPFLDLHKNAGDGYWIFTFDDPDRNLFEQESVYTVYLNQMSIDVWVSIGKDLADRVENQFKERSK